MIRIISAALVGVAALFVVPVATASADEQSYINDLNNNGFTGGVAGAREALAWGYAACNANNSGLPIQDQVAVVYANTNDSISYADAQFIVEAAQIYLC